MKNYDLAEICARVFELTRRKVNLDEYLTAICDEMKITDWESLAGFLLDLDNRNADALDPKIRGCFVLNMRGLRFSATDWLLLYLRQENAVRQLSSAADDRIPPGLHLADEGSACSWSLTEFWRMTRRIELEFAAKRHLGT